MSENNFMKRCLRGDALLEEIDEDVAAWHDGDSQDELHDHLGMTWDEYALWVEKPESLAFVVCARKNGVDVGVLLQQEAASPMAARAVSPDEAEAILAWLRRTKRLESTVRG